MATTNTSTGYTPFHLHLGRTPRLLPSLTPDAIRAAREDFPTDIANTLEAIVSLKTDVADAHDALLASCVAQAHTANAHRNADPSFEPGDFVYLSTAHRRREYLNGSNKRVAKFMPRFDGPYAIVSANPESSTYTSNISCLRAQTARSDRSLQTLVQKSGKSDVSHASTAHED